MSNTTATPAATSRGAMNNANLYRPNTQQPMSSTSMIAPDGTTILSDEEIERIMDNFANEDTAYNKTWTRIVVENVLSKVRFVFPSFPYLNTLNVLKRVLMCCCGIFSPNTFFFRNQFPSFPFTHQERICHTHPP